MATGGDGDSGTGKGGAKNQTQHNKKSINERGRRTYKVERRKNGKVD